MGRRRAVVVLQDAMRRALQIVELTAVDGPPEQRTDQEDEHKRQRDEQIQDVHAVILTGPRTRDQASRVCHHDQ